MGRAAITIVGIALGVLLLSADPGAHEIGTTRVEAVFNPSREYRIEIVTDASSLAEKLEAAAGDAIAATNDPAALESRIRVHDALFRRRVLATFDGAAVAPHVDYSVSRPSDAGSGPLATIVLTGRVPDGAERFSWSYSWTFATYALTVRTSVPNGPTTEWLEGGQASAPAAVANFTGSASPRSPVLSYLALGFTHIVPGGVDHILFVLGIFLLGRRVREVLAQVSAFTVAHSITLALSMYGVVALSPRIVEPLIAASIAYVAIENIFTSELKQWRLALVFTFGLLHGLGFAGALQEIGLPRSEFLTALVSFNVGVEAGQLAVIGAAFLVVGWYGAGRPWYRWRVVLPASMAIACTAVYWTFERLSL